MSIAGERAFAARAAERPVPRKRKVVLVTNSLPGHDAGFAKSGHAQYLESFITHFVGRGFDVLLAVPSPRVDFLWRSTAAFRYRIVSPSLKTARGRVVVSSVRAAAAVIVWLTYARLPRRLQVLGSLARNVVRRARGFSHVLGSFLDESQRTFVRETLERERPDLLVYDGIFNVCGGLGETPAWIVTHEIKHQRARSFQERGIGVLPANFSAESERALLSEVGNVIAIQWDEGAEFRRLLPEARVVVVPVTIDLPAVMRRTEPACARCLFVGSGSFHNVDGIRWFLDACWPSVRAKVPNATLDIYGTVCYRLGELPDGVRAHGVAPDLAAAYGQAALAIVPLKIGSGLKVKLVEALGYGMPVVTTPVGAQGLSAFDPVPFLIADSADDFAAACVRVLSTDVATDLSAAALRCAERFRPDAAFADFAAATDGVPEASSLELPEAPVSVCIAIPTYRRLEMLPRLLAAIGAQSFDPGLATVEVVLIDNDPKGVAAAFAAERRENFRFPLQYEHVPDPGLAMVRNRGLAFVAGRCDYLAMIDDDEVPDAQWLAELVGLARQTRADVVVGPVFPVLPVEGPHWIAQLRGKETPLLSDGALLREGWSCNALVSVAAVARCDVRFDPALNFAGGEDQLFFRQMVARGAKIVFASGAVVREFIAPERLAVRFNLARAYRRGNSLSFCDRRMSKGPSSLVLRAVKGIAHVAVGAAIMPLSLARGESILVEGACRVAHGFGMLAGLIGRMHQAYRRSD